MNHMQAGADRRGDTARSRHGVLVGIAASLGAVLMLGSSAGAGGKESGEKTVRGTCTACHRIEGKPAPRRTKKAPDLIWAGNKYQPQWLVGWLQNPEFKHYPVGYDFRPERKKRHLVPPADQANAVADFLATLKNPRIKAGVMKRARQSKSREGKNSLGNMGAKTAISRRPRWPRVIQAAHPARRSSSSTSV